VKEIAGFLRYCWHGMDTWARLLILSVMLNIASVFAPESMRLFLQIAGWSIIFSLFFKIAVWDWFLDKWTKYKNHRNQLLTTIKDSSK
jgi:ABC-type iron transport system FetAB permease component